MYHQKKEERREDDTKSMKTIGGIVDERQRRIVMKKKSLLCIMLAIIMCLSSTLTAYAAVSWPSISSHKPIKVYTISTGNNTAAYSDSTFQHKIGTIYASDELYVQSIYQNDLSIG